MKKIIGIITLVFLLAGVSIAYASSKPYNSERLYGANRYDTAQEIAQKVTTSKVDNIVVATGENFPDALSGSLLAKRLKAPIFLVDNSDNSKLISFMHSKLNTNGTVYIIGGNGVVSDNFEASLGVKTKRISGTDRFQTNNCINSIINADIGTPIIIATGEDFPDALSMSAVSAIKGYPIVLASKDSLTQETMSYIKNMKPSQVYIAGGTGVVSSGVEAQINSIAGVTAVRLSGTNRYTTSLEIAKYFNFNTSSAVIATGQDFPDALAGSVLASSMSAPILLTPTTDCTAQKDYLDTTSISNVEILGGYGAISKGVEYNLREIPLPIIDTLPLGNSGQAIIIKANSASDVYDTCEVYEKTNGDWNLKWTFSCVVGKNGVSANRHEGDMTTPEGIYGFVTAFGSASNPGTKMPYRQTHKGDYWSSYPTQSEYNTWVTGNYDYDPYHYEKLYTQPLYKYALALDFNYSSSKVIGKGSGIFFHIAPYSGGGTAGCVGVSEDNLLTILKWLNLSQNPKICIGTNDYLNILR